MIINSSYKILRTSHKTLRTNSYSIITTSGKLISKHLNKGDVFVFPKALLHFQQNPNNAPASVIAAFDSQLPGTQVITTSLFGANPPINDDILAKAFAVPAQDVQKLKGKFTPKK